MFEAHGMVEFSFQNAKNLSNHPEQLQGKGPVKLKVLHSTGRFGIKIVRICGKAKDRTFQYPIRDYPDAEDELDEGAQRVQFNICCVLLLFSIPRT